MRWQGVSLGEAGISVEVTDTDGGPAVELVTGFPVGGGVEDALRTRVREALAPAPLAGFRCRARIVPHEPQPPLSPSPRIRNIVAVGSGKGGVGKSTTAVNLALALAPVGARVGLLDAAVYGPSIPTMLGLSGKPESPDGKSIVPMRAHGIEAMSIGLLVEHDTPMIWRGPI